MLIRLQPMGSFIEPVPIGIGVVIFLLSIVLFALLRKEGKPIQAVLAPMMLLSVFFGVLLHELNKVYSLEYKEAQLLMETPLGTRETVCQNIEFLIRRHKNSCVVLAFRDNDDLFHSVGVNRARCETLVEELRQIPCKPSDSAKHNRMESLR